LVLVKKVVGETVIIPVLISNVIHAGRAGFILYVNGYMPLLTIDGIIVSIGCPTVNVEELLYANPEGLDELIRDKLSK